MENRNFYDEEEKHLVESVENEEWESTNNLIEVEKMLSLSINRYKNKRKKIQLSVNTDDLFKLKRISSENGISIEVLINALIHNYTKGNIALNL